jgi:hypothetical protein
MIKTCQSKDNNVTCNNAILHTKGYMFRLYLSHLQANKGQIHTISMDLTLEGLKMTQVESKHVALRM